MMREIIHEQGERTKIEGQVISVVNFKLFESTLHRSSGADRFDYGLAKSTRSGE